VIPGWLMRGNPPAVGFDRGKAGFLEKTLNAVASYAAATLLFEGHAGRAGLLQRIAPTVKLPGILVLIVTVSLLRSPAAIWGAVVLALVLAVVSGIAPGTFVKRASPCVLLFGVAVALPAVFSVVTPGESLWRVAGPWGSEIAVTRQGLQAGTVLVGRVAASVSLALLLPLTTRWHDLIRAFAALRLPRLFVLILAMTYRYIALLVQTVAELHEARASRTVRYLPAGAERRWVASRMGYLFGKSYRMSQEVHDAMLARGFAGEVKRFEPRKAGKRDMVWLVLALVLSTALLVLDRVNWR